VGFTCLYAFTCSVYLPPYRDGGEMAIFVETLGVAHPPGYPLYALIGHLFTYFPIGNIVFRVNLFSAFCGAATLFVLFWVLRKWLPRFVSFMTCCILGFSNPFWELSVVTEMYSLGLLWVCLLLYSCFVLKKPLLTAFLMSLGLGVRMDMMLLFPLFVGWFYWKRDFRNWILFVLFFSLGLSVFLYMPIRSTQEPLLDWANPDNLTTLFNSVTRKSYGGTLDLLSLNYQKGENFIVGMTHYVRHVNMSFGVWFWPLLIMGFWFLTQKNRLLFFFLFSCFFITAPIYLFLANMPPNPHALAVLEATYPVPDILLVIVAGFGLAFLCENRFVMKTAFVVLPILLFVNASNGFEMANKRGNSFTRDYVVNVFRSSPKASVVVFHEDVQLFSLWQEQVLYHKRKDLNLISSGLSASPWYWSMLSRWGVPSLPPVAVKTSEGLLKMKKKLGTRPLLLGQESNLKPFPGMISKPHGFLLEILEEGQDSFGPSSFVLDELCVYRGPYRYGAPTDFFSSDLISDYARAYTRWGLHVLSNGKDPLAEWFFRRAEALEPLFPRPSSHLGYLHFKQGRYADALEEYQKAIRKHEIMLGNTKGYKSLPNLVKGIKREMADTYASAGTAAEKIKELELARSYYLRACDLTPHAQAYYNLAVTYWEHDWNEVVMNLELALKVNPNMAMAQKFLDQARYRRQKERR